MARVDYETMAASYDRGRGLELDGIDAWRVALGRYLPPQSELPVLDLGAGTGQFAGAFTAWFNAREPGELPTLFPPSMRPRRPSAPPALRWRVWRAFPKCLPPA